MRNAHEVDPDDEAHGLCDDDGQVEVLEAVVEVEHYCKYQSKELRDGHKQACSLQSYSLSKRVTPPIENEDECSRYQARVAHRETHYVGYCLQVSLPLLGLVICSFASHELIVYLEDHEGDLDEDEDPDDVDASPHSKATAEAVGSHSPKEGVNISLACVGQSVIKFVVRLQFNEAIIVVIIVNLHLKVILFQNGGPFVTVKYKGTGIALRVH